MGVGVGLRKGGDECGSASRPVPAPSFSSSTSTTDTINGSHHFKITGYSLSKGLGIGKYIASENFRVGDYSWAIYFYPDGKSAEDNAAYVSLFIALSSEGTDVRALFELTLLDQSGNERHKVHTHFGRRLEDGPYTLKYRGSMWGYKRFFRRTLLEASDYLKDDCLSVQCSIGVVQSHTEGPKTYSIQMSPSNIGEHFGHLLESGKGSDVTLEVDDEIISGCKMGFKSVYRSLVEVFPQVDDRILKAVAIEHSKDADAAVEFILSEVISHEAIPSISMNNGDNGPSGLAGVDRAEDMSDVGFTQDLLTLMEGSEATSTERECLVKDDDRDLLPYYEKREDNNFEYGETTTAQALRSFILDTDDAETTTEKHLHSFQASTSGSTLGEAGSTVCEKSVSLDTSLSEKILLGDIEPSQSAVKGEISSSEKIDAAIEIAISGLNATQSDNLPLEDMYHSIVDSEGVQVGDGLDHGDVVRSSQLISSDFLDEFVTEAKTYKKSMASGMESLMSMAKEVEMQEASANQAKEEASNAGIDLLAKVEEMKKMLQHAKAANEMRAGEVYGEKSILATEARELQSRLLSLSDQRDQSLLRIHEIRQKLEARLAAAHEERIMAEKEKLENEEIAVKAVAEQESIMATVVQESKNLQEEAEENAKLEEFLIDRGRMVDQLQGEISVICEDIKLMQERVDARLPIGRVLSSSSMSNSSSSTYALKMASTSHRSVEPAKTLENSKTSSEALSKSDASVESMPLQFNMTRQKAPSDDEWEMFDEDFRQHARVNVLSGHVISA